ncbi:MAG: B12-binding domain-containing radical SAM protein [Thermodesulfovibrionia bacterium]|nr:B12-binding domain-containing radical SAM protein [Thermodesulfovibrionia bacterium]
MRILLTTSAAPRQSPFFCNEKRFPLGLGFLLSVLREAGHDVYFIDNFVYPVKFWAEGFLEKQHIDFVGIYSSTICYEGTKEIIEGCDRLRKSGKWNGKIMLGGPHTSVATSPLPDCVDYVVRGEGEKAILDIVQGVAKPGIIDGKRVEDLDTLPLPAYDIFCHHTPPYHTSVECFPDTPVFTMNTSRGCPFSCNFCSVQGVWGRRYRLFSAERIIDDIKRLISDFDIKGVYFREDNFTGSLKRVTNFCEMLLSQDIKIKWLCESRVRPLPKPVMALMAKAGCRWLYLGCESGSQRVLDLINKQINVEDIRNVINWGKELGIKCYTSWMVGVPGETERDRQMTYSLIRELKPYSAGVHVFTGLPGSKLYQQMLETSNYVYKDNLGLLYSADWNQLAVHINSYLAENKFCPVQTIPFKVYKVIRRRILGFARKYPRPFKRIASHPFLTAFDETQMRILSVLDKISNRSR